MLHIVETLTYMICYRYAPSPDPSLSIDFYERTPEQQASLGYLVDQSQTREQENEASSTNQTSEPHGSVGAVAGRRAIAQGTSAEFAESLFRYTAPEEVLYYSPFDKSGIHLFLIEGYINMYHLCR